MSYAKIWLKSQLIYKWSFLLLCVGQFFVPFFVFIGVILLFERFESIAGWDFYEVGILYGSTHLSFAITECFVRGFDSFSGLVVSGDFDRLLVRPLPTSVQVLGSKLEFTRIGRMIQGLVVLCLVLSRGTISWTLLKAFTLLAMIIGGIGIFTGLFIVFATLAFWTVEGLEIANIFTDGGRELTQYPLTVYAKPVAQFFTYVVPFAFVNYKPLMYLLDKGPYTSDVYAFLPLIGLLFIIPSLVFWSYGVRHYRSTGS